jgi:hypothetical protein
MSHPGPMYTVSTAACAQRFEALSGVQSTNHNPHRMVPDVTHRDGIRVTSIMRDTTPHVNTESLTRAASNGR